MGVGETPAAEIRHRIGFSPDHVIENPVAQVLQDGADAENIVIGADHPKRPIGLQGAAAFGEPGPGEFIIGGKARKLVPVVVNRIDLALVRPRQVARELQIIRRIREDEVNRARRDLLQFGKAIAHQHAVVERPDIRLCFETHR